ncbi:hypothetical protein [Mycobacteroides chelonae]|uniref:hypothetical protein n=1 Tax=Mycobacteroides chelonae TaxID=1774 RepID=UPI0035668B57
MHPLTTDSDIRVALLAALTPELQPWAVIRRRIPGSDEAQAAALTHLFESYAVTVTKITGTPYVRLASDLDRRAAAAQRDRAAQVHPALANRPRDFVAV